MIPSPFDLRIGVFRSLWAPEVPWETGTTGVGWVKGAQMGWGFGFGRGVLVYCGWPKAGLGWGSGQAPQLWSKSSSGRGSGSAGSKSGVWSRLSGWQAWTTSSCSVPRGPMWSSVWGGSRAGWISLAIAAAQSGRRVYYATLIDLITSLEEAKASG